MEVVCVNAIIPNRSDGIMFTALSDELISDIFTRLPIDSVVRCRSVCKAWCRFVDGESFVRLYTQINPHDSRSDTLVIRESKGGCLYSLSLDALSQSTDGSEIDATPIKKLIQRGIPLVGPLPAATCNGLILISNYKADVILNPLTREIHKLPAPRLLLLAGGFFRDLKRITIAGFGYDRTTDDYKAVRVYERQRGERGEETVRRTLVYSLKSGIWRKTPKDYTGNVSLRGSYDAWGYVGVHLDGKLYFETSTLDAIVVFDLATEEYSPLLIRTPFDPPKFLVGFQYTYGLAGHLIFTEYSHQLRRQKVWVMRDDGLEVEEGSSPWMELFEISGDISAGWGLHLVAYMESKSLFFLQQRNINDRDDDALFCVDIVNKSMKMIKIDGLLHFTSHQFCLGTRFRLGDSDGSVHSKKRRKMTNTPSAQERLRFRIKQEECPYKMGA